MRILLLLTMAGLAGAAGVETIRLQVGGEWCFIKIPAKRRAGEGVLAIHGNGQTVGEKTSSFEEGAPFQRLMNALLDKGYIVAQSNHGATPDNGMWGNAKTQAGVAALAGHLKSKYGIRRIHAVAVSAGGATLMNLALDRKLRFATALLIVPVISLESMYRCPDGIDRVKGLSEAFGFQARSGCPGDPVTDSAFLSATEGFDPLRRMKALPPAELKGRLGRVRWMSVYNTRDPRVPSAENIIPMSERMKRAGVDILLRSSGVATHSADEPLAAYESEILSRMEESK